MTRIVTIELPEDVYLYIELRAAIDDLRPPEAISKLLAESVKIAKGRVDAST